MNTKQLFCSFLLLVFLISCKEELTTKELVDVPIGEKIEFYLIDSFETTGFHSAINDSSITLVDTPLIRYNDILAYNSSEHYFLLSDKGRSAITQLTHSVHGLAFAITADKELVYSAYFWPSYSSAMCMWATLEPFSIEKSNKAYVNLGYPGTFEGVNIPDHRNDKRIIATFKSDGKLK